MAWAVSADAPEARAENVYPFSPARYPYIPVPADFMNNGRMACSVVARMAVQAEGTPVAETLLYALYVLNRTVGTWMD